MRLTFRPFQAAAWIGYMFLVASVTHSVSAMLFAWGGWILGGTEVKVR